MDTRKRKGSAWDSVRAAGFDALLLTHSADIRYLSGFTGSAGALVLAGNRSVLFTDGRYTEQARAEAKGTRVVIARGSPLRAACESVEAAGLNRCAYDPAHTTVAALAVMRAALSPPLRRRLFHPAEPLLSRQREIKDASELALLRAAADLGCTLFDQLLPEIKPALTERELALDLEVRARRLGAEKMSFETIVAGAGRSALPHARPSAAKLPRRGFVTLDFGVVLNGYCSDMTRTVHLGRVSPEARAVYDSVLEAQGSAIDRVAPGVPVGEVDRAAREVLRKAKLDRFFTHSTGHGLGLEIHEGPRIAANEIAELKPGMVITIEPGVYLGGRFGVRIEDMVLVTDRGCEVLTSTTKALIEL